MMREQWGFSIAGEVVFGSNAVLRLGEKIKKNNFDSALVFTDPGVSQAGLLERALGSLQSSNIKYEIFEHGQPEPSIEIVNEAYSWSKEKKHDVLIGLGGGSVIDLAKALSVMLSFGGPIDQYFGEGKLPGNPKPIIAIPTTSGTGSSVSPASVLTDSKANLKKGISDNRLRPSLALVDPLLTVSCPPFLTACTGIDVLAHAIEAYTAISFQYLALGQEEEKTALYHGSNPMGDTLAQQAIRLVGNNLRLAVNQGLNIEARTNMALANILAGMAFSNAGVTAVHAMAYPLGAYSHAPHGLVNGLLLPHVLEYNLPVCAPQLARTARWLGENINGLSEREAAFKTINSIQQLIQDIGLPSKMRDIGIKEESIRPMAEATLGVTRLLRSNPRKMTADDLEAVFRQAY
ncbi:MAG: iron-containing alcohol dehydrogenase [Desulfohalobiaceae bacterium]|nr:iron-containing alcohol dehydrogenase [Desulfohalobiaceae bacterium]